MYKKKIDGNYIVSKNRKFIIIVIFNFTIGIPCI